MSRQTETVLEMFNPLAGKTFSAGAGPDLLMRPAGDCARFSLRIPVEQLKKAVNAFGQDIPANIGDMSSDVEKYALCLGPDEWLLLAPLGTQEEIIAQFIKLSPDIPHALVDVSQRTIGIEIRGPVAALTINAGCPLDLENMPVGRCTRSILDKAEIIVMKLEQQRYRLEIMRSFAPFVWSLLEKAGGEFAL